VAAEEAQRAVPTEAAKKTGREEVAMAVGPAERKPKAVVVTTRAERRALVSSARVCALDGGLVRWVLVAVAFSSEVVAGERAVE